ncbi:hypothetical protein J2Z33_002820 [Rubellimicrobium aerolatum]|nr:hypothetical protein [Rubellimicrobium aerolatum]
MAKGRAAESRTRRASRVELLVPDRFAHGVVGQHLQVDANLVGDECEITSPGREAPAGVAQCAELERKVQAVVRPAPDPDSAKIVGPERPVSDQLGLTVR